MSAIESLDDILTFIKVVELSSFQKTARHFNISASLVSKRITRLEVALNVQLLQRSTRQLTLTEAGNAYYQKIQTIPLQLETAREQILPLNDAMQGKLHLVLPYGFDNSIKQHVLPQFMHDYPDIDFAINVTDKPWSYFNSTFDILISGKRTDKKFPDSNLVARHFLNLPAGIYASKKYLQQHGTPQKPTDLLKHRCISFFDGDDWPFIDVKGKQYVVTVKSCFYSNSSGLMQGIVEKNCGICYGFDFMFTEMLNTGEIIKILEPYVPKTLLEVYLFYPQTKYLPLKTRTLIDRIIEHYKELKS